MRTLGLRGVDLSHYQKTTQAGVIKRASDGEPVGHLSEFSFAIVKATHGPAMNSAWPMHSANVRRAGLVLGAYHWLTDADPIKAQVAEFLRVAADADFLVVDQEEAGVSDGETQRFIDLCRASGRPVILYHSSSGFAGVDADGEWVADYRAASVEAGYPMTAIPGQTPVEFPGWDIWQWTSKGGDDGEGLDENWLNPVTPLAVILRKGFISQQASDTELAASLAEQAAAYEAEKATLAGQLRDAQDLSLMLQTTLDARIADLREADDEIQRLNSELLQAAVIERNRIAAKYGEQEAQRIRNM